MVRYDLKKKEGTFKQQTVVARVENVVVTLDYNGAGLAGEKAPSADTLAKHAEKAAKEAVARCRRRTARALRQPGPVRLRLEGPVEAPSKSASPSGAPSKSASKSASPSKSAAKTGSKKS